MHRFQVTKEMDHDIINFFDNESWFDIKFITEIWSKDMRKSISNSTYYQTFKKAYLELGIPSAHCFHLSRVLGSCESGSTRTAAKTFAFLATGTQKFRSSATPPQRCR